MKTYNLTTPSSTPLDVNGQPMRLFKANAENNSRKALQQLSGICAGILADGVVNLEEANFFAQWVRTYAPAEPVWPFTDILERVKRIFKDGRCDPDEQKELEYVMKSLCGQDNQTKPKDQGSEAKPTETRSTKLPFNLPLPKTVLFPNHNFVITGKFAFGTRKNVIEAISEKGGIGFGSNVTYDTNYLVIGEFASRDWITTNYGRKIEKAVELRDSGSKVVILSEEHWRKFVT